MRFLLIFALICTSAFGLSLRKINLKNLTQEVEQIAMGFMIGLGALDKVPDAFQCIQVVETAKNATLSAIAKIKSHDIPQVLDGLKDLVAELENLYEPCSKTVKEGKNFSHEIISDIKSKDFRKQALTRVFSNFLKVVEDLEKAEEDLKNKQYFEAGIALGNVGKIYFYGPSTANVSLLSLGSVNWQWTNCGSTSDPYQVSGVTLDNQPAKGTNNGITISGTMNAHVELKEVDIDVTIGGAPLHHESAARSDILDPSQPFTYQYSVAIPGFAPSGTYAVKFSIVNTDGSNAGCVQINFNL